MDCTDTIAAICTGAGGAIAIIRISGSRALELGNRVWKGGVLLSSADSRRMLLGHALFSGGGGDAALAVYMPGPKSYTGEDIVELHCHGGGLNTRRILENVLGQGARLAEAGEFSYRAFMNGKMDLTQAEGVLEVIGAGSDMALRLAERQVDGVLGRRVRTVYSRLVEMLAECESRLDFGEEDLDWTPAAAFNAALSELRLELSELLSSRREGTLLRDGVRVVIAGRPNAGKSSLLNLLLGYDRAIVTHVPGTTRDTLEEHVNLRGIPVRLVDTAGIREADDIIEGMGIARSRRSIREAQVVLWLLDASSPDREEELEVMRGHVSGDVKVLAVWNKVDLCEGEELPSPGIPSVGISVSRGWNVERLLDMFEEAVWGYPHGGEVSEVAVSSRHAVLLERVVEELPQAASRVDDGDWELAAVHLREAMASLGSITGETADPDLLGNIFSRFCIGK